MSDFEKIHKRHIDEARAFTPQAVARLKWTRDQVLEAQTMGLRKVVAHAQEHSPFYANCLGGIEASTMELSDLSTIPPMTKAMVMDHWDDIVTDKRLSLASVTEHLERLHRSESENPYLHGEVYAAATGGTSGKRGVFLWDWETYIVTTNICYRMEMAQDLIHPPTGPRRTAVVCAGSYVHASRLLFPTSLDPDREMRVFPANLPLKQMVRELNAFQPDRLVGFASIVGELCDFALDGVLKIPLKRICTNSEPLYPEMRQKARDAWGINIHNSWGSVELGLAGTEGESFGGVSMAEDFLIFEPVDAQDRAVEDPTSSDRLLGTKLFGTAMPMIRYEMTDTMTFDLGENPDAPGSRRITEIKGRADTWFIYGGSIKVHPMIFRGVLGQDRHISEYQVQQTEKGALVRVVTHGDFAPARVRDDLKHVLNDAGLQDAEVTMECVTDLPRHPQTNKLTRFVPLAGS